MGSSPGEPVFSGAEAAGPVSISYEVRIEDPICADNPVQYLELIQYLDENGFPAEYSCDILCEVLDDGQSRKVQAVIFWDMIGHYKRFEILPGMPLTKKDNIAFNDEDYGQLHQVLKDRESVLGSHMLDYLARPGGVDPNVDGMSAATPKTLQQAVVQDAAWTTWVIWQYANGGIVGKLRQITDEGCTPDFLKFLLQSNDLYQNEFALEVLIRSGQFDTQYLDSLLQALERGDNGNVSLALQYLDSESADKPALYGRLIDSFHRMEKGYIPMVVRFLAMDPDLPSETLDQLTGPLSELSYFQVNAILDLLEERGYFSEKSKADVSRLLNSSSSIIADRARMFLMRNN